MNENETVASNPHLETRVLRDDELETVSGGHASFNDFALTHHIDKASPVLL
jgi:type VI protein secretion system component Hcp